MEQLTSWLRSFRGTDSDRQIAINSGIPVATLARQLRDGTVTVETAVKIARAYQVSVVPALLALDVLTEFDLKAFSTSSGIMDASDEDLVAEILRRMKAGQADWAEKPISELDTRRNAKRGNNSPTPPPHVTEPDYDAILDGINAGTEPIAAQKATDPLEENYT